MWNFNFHNLSEICDKKIMEMDGNNVFMFPAGFVYAFGISFIFVERKE